MHPRSIRATAFIFTAALFAVAPLAQAQVTLNLTTTQQTNCTAVTDAQGLRLAAGGTNLLGTGVTLTGTGCGGSSGDNYQVAVQAPATAFSGTPFNVAWSASALATQCFYTGTSGSSGWPVGASACQGAACSGNHSSSVTVSAAGNPTFGMVCSNGSGSSQGTTAVSGPPLAPQPPNFALVANPASPVAVGASFQVTWSVSGAASCTATAELGGTTTALPGWTDAGNSINPVRTVTPAVAGTYTLHMTCSNTNGSTASAPLTVVAQSGNPDSCPVGRLTTGTVCYNYVTSGNSCVTADLTKFENIWGRQWLAGVQPPVVSSPVKLFPGTNPSIATIAALGGTQYIAAKFVMPAGLPADQHGLLYHAETFPGVNPEMTITSDCGNFAPAEPKCGPLVTASPGQVIAAWKLSTATGYSAYCPLVAGQTYFVNMRFKNAADCTGACSTTIQNNHTP